ncbi:CoiA-like family protein [Listeria floridensis FSL S10-1187]|uniref:CoiA-like family protein n=1 Tax=Listeria floridensis FSL S10-1187 TaxID=1265817 RepID=A0ABN0RDQ1_9LIST|nr:CoiA-like family protein [Listeria floridensis FSL S10-1187]
MLGKQTLAKWLAYQGHEVELESFLKLIKRQADILVDGQMVIEFQCSTVPIEQLIERNYDYSELPLNTIWLLGQRVSESKLGYSISKFQLGFVRKTSLLGYYLLFFSPEKKQFECIHHLIHAGGKHFYGQKLVLGLHLSVRDMELKMSKARAYSSSRERNVRCDRARLCYYYAKFKQHSKFMNHLYQSGFALQNLPDQVGVQLDKQFLVHTPPVEWQFGLWLDFFDRLEPGDIFGFESISERFSKSVRVMKTIVLDSDEHLELLRDYLLYLEESDILVEFAEGRFRMKQKMKWHGNPRILS